MGNEASVWIAASDGAGYPVVLTDAASSANAIGVAGYPLVLKAGGEHWDTVDPAPVRAAKDPFDPILSGRKRRGLRFEQDQLGEGAMPLGLGRRTLRKDSSLAN